MNADNQKRQAYFIGGGLASLAGAVELRPVFDPAVLQV